MRQVITRAQAIRYMIIALSIIAILCIFPFRLFKETITGSGNEHPAGALEVGGDKVVLQQFVPEYDHIASIVVYLKGDYYDDTLTLRVFKESNAALLREVTVSTDRFHRVDEKTYKGSLGEGYADIYINLDTVVGDGYFYTIEGISTDYEFLYENTGNSGATNNGRLEYCSETKDAYNLMTRYTYEQPMRKIRSLIYIAAIALLGVLLIALVNLLEKKFLALQTLCTIQWILRIVLNPVIVALAILSIVFIGPLHIFSIYISEIVVMILGVLLLSALLLWAVNRKYDETDISVADYLKNNWRALAQSVCIALALWACVNYMNALYEIFHDIAWRKMAFFLGLGIIISFSVKELVNVYNLILLIAGVICARIYYVKNLADMVDEYHVEAMMWTCRLMPVILIMTAYIVRCIVFCVKDKKVPFKMISIPYAVMSVIMGIAMILRRHNNYWPVLMVVIGLVFAVRYLFWEDRVKFTDIILNGVLIHFGACVIYCLLHRPYDFSIYVRFPFVFHTVTITGEYMSLVMAAAVVKLFSKYSREKKILKCIPEMCIMGVVTTYFLFTMCRTAMIAIVAMGLVMWVAYSFKKEGVSRIKSLGIMAGAVICAAVLCIPVVYSAQRALPALVGEPRILEVETYPQALLISNDPGSEDYITFSRLTKAFCHKMLGIDEDKIKLDLYTIYGKRNDVYVSPTDQALMDSADADFSDVNVYSEGLLLSHDIRMYSYDANGGFIPPYDYPLDEEPPEEWWSEEYWVYRPETHEWEFADWKVAAEHESDVTNGRLDIYMAYLQQLTPEGHEDMGALLADGSTAAHAHNIYLQVAYDNGIIVGIMFILWVIVTCVQALIVFIRHRKIDPAAGTVLAVSVTYAVCGLTEWISHPCNPVGLIMLLCVVPLALYKYEHIDETV